MSATTASGPSDPSPEPRELLARVLGLLGSGISIGGAWREASSGRTLTVENPATGAVLREVADGGQADARAAMDAAGAAQEGWAATSPRERSDVLRRAFDLVTERAEEAAVLMTAEMGKPLAQARAEVTYGADFLRWFADEAVRIPGDAFTNPAGTNRVLVTRRPVGPCILVTPWNFPLAMATRKLGPALAAGCTSVVKPAALTPLTTLWLAAVLGEAGVPDGVVNVVTTTDAGSVVGPWISSGTARKLSFTGSTGVGRSLLAQCAEGVLRTSMELGGNAPFVVCEDADLDTAVDAALAAKMRNMGEACTAANRFLVHSSVAAEFTERVTERMAAQRLGDGMDEGTDVGPLISADAHETVTKLVAGALDGGARLHCGGPDAELPGGELAGGHFHAPTVLSGVDPSAEIARTEIFGPVLAVAEFDTDDQAVAAANSTEYGLAAFVVTDSLDRALRYSERIEAGMVGVNTGIVSDASAPFGGVKASGLGREGGAVGIDEYLEVKATTIAMR